jgi:succinate dehydrogenase hydrophobic anchor subunit
MVTRATISEAAAPAVAEGAPTVCTHHPLLQVHRAQPGCKCGNLRPPRKLHALTGLWLALFVNLHLAICVTGMRPRRYQSVVALLHRVLACFPVAMPLLILLPLLLQSGSGLYLLVKEGLKYDLKRCDRGGKLRFLLQRYSGLAILAFLVVHVGSMHGWRLPSSSSGILGGAAFAFTASAFQPWNSPVANLITIMLLLTGILGVIFHVTNGAWSGAILWKAIATPQSKLRWSYLCALAGIVLMTMGTVAWYAFTLSPNVHAGVRR